MALISNLDLTLILTSILMAAAFAMALTFGIVFVMRKCWSECERVLEIGRCRVKDI